MKSIVYCLSVAVILSSCAMPRKKERPVEYIPGYRRIESVKKGDEAPFDGFLIPPAVMSDIGPCLSEALKDNEEDDP